MARARPLTLEERQTWTSELGDSRFAIPAANLTLRAAHFVFEVSVDNINVLYVLPTATVASRLQSKLNRVVARLAMLSKDLRIPSLKYVIIPCSEKRLWPMEGKPVENIHINGAFTYKMGDTVFIFREEEYPKVMLHEALHHSFLDPSPSAMLGVESIVRQNFNISPHMALLVGEGVVELFATYYHCKFVAEETGVQFAALWECETKWMHRQALKVLERTKTTPWHEYTNAFAYIVVRWICAGDINSIFRLLKERAPLLPFFTAAIKTALVAAHLQSVSNLSHLSQASMRLTMLGDL